MIFKELKLNNFKSYVDTTINFDSGVTLFVGENGAGKSSIFEAISFALFKQFTGKNLSSLIRSNKNQPVNEMSVSLTFYSNGSEYRVIRGISKSKSKVSLEKRDNQSFGFITLCEGDKLVNNQIKSILEMDADLFLNAIYVRQGEIADLVGKTAAERKKLISKLLKLEDLEVAWKNSLNIVNDYDKKASELRGLIASDSSLNLDLKSKNLELYNLSEKKKNLIKSIEELNNSKENINNAKIKMDEEKKAYEEFNLKLDGELKLFDALKKSKSELHGQIDELAKNEEEKNRLEKYVKKLPLYLDFEAACNNLVLLQKDKKEQEEVIRKIDSYNEVLEKNKASYDDYLTLEARIKELNEKKSKLVGDLKVVDKFKEDKVKAQSNLENDEKKLSEFLSKAKYILSSFISEEDLQEIEDDFNFSKLNDLVVSINSKLNKEINFNNELIKLSTKDVNECESKIKASQKSLEELNEVEGKCPVCSSDITEDKKKDLIDSCNKEIEENNNKIKELTTKLSKIEAKNDTLSSKIQLISDFEKEIYAVKGISENIENNKKNIEDLDVKLNELTANIKELEEVNSLLDDANKNISELKDKYESYKEAMAALNVLSKKREINEKLYSIEGKISLELEKVKHATDNDMYLSVEMSEEDLQSKIKELKEKEQRFNELTGLIRHKPKYLSQLESKKDEIKIRTIEIEKIKKSIKNSLYDEEKFNELKLLQESNSSNILKANKELSETSGRITEIVPVIKSLEESIKVNKIYKKELEGVEKFLKLLKEIRSLYGKDGIQKVLRTSSIPVIQKNTKEFFEKFNFEYSDLTLDDDYEISLYGPEGESKLDMISGGEKIAVALALRLGITQAMAKGSIETILLDEPTIHLDEFRENKLIDLIKEMSVIPQMIIVTHSESLESAADHIFKVKKENGISKVNKENILN